MNKIYTGLLILVSVVFLASTNVVSATDSPDFRPQVSITFDDAYANTFTNALPILEAKNIKATAYITTGFVGNPEYMTWDQVTKLQDEYGWEIGAHSQTHPDLELADSAERKYEIDGAVDILRSKGFTVNSYATPFGSYNNKVLAETRKVVLNHRTFWDRDNYNKYPYDATLLTVQSVQSNTTLDQVTKWIDDAQAKGQWLILVLHQVVPNEVKDDPYVTTTKELQEIADYIADNGIKTTRVSETFNSNPSIVPDGEFATDPFASGWLTDSSSLVEYNKKNHGAYPNAVSSLKIKASSDKWVHLFSPLIAVSSVNTYALTTFVNTDHLSDGEFGFYIDEYNSDGDWISGQWLGSVNLNTVIDFNTLYTPSSAEVKYASIQNYLSDGARGYVFLDSMRLQLASEEDVDPSPTPTPTIEPTVTPSLTPTVTPTPTPTPTVINLLTNGDFETLDGDGWVSPWTRSSDLVSLATDPNNSTQSVSFTAGSPSHYLFSETIDVDSTKIYLWTGSVTTDGLNGEFGFYIDECNSDGDWISGQWKGAIYSDFTGTTRIDYQPSSSSVSEASLQYYYLGSNLGTVFVDDVVFSLQ